MFSKPNALVYVYRSGLFTLSRHAPQVRLKFPPELVNNLEVLNPQKFRDTCQRFFASNGLKGKRVLMVLDYNVVFEKKIDLDKSGKPDVLAEGFIAAIPFEPGQRACLSVATANRLRLFATNADLYLALADALRISGIAKLAAITPVAAYNLAGVERTVDSLAERLFNDAPARKQADFCNVSPV